MKVRNEPIGMQTTKASITESPKIGNDARGREGRVNDK
jgi:hypothetical protein